MGKHNLSNYILPGGDEQSEEDPASLEGRHSDQ